MTEHFLLKNARVLLLVSIMKLSLEGKPSASGTIRPQVRFHAANLIQTDLGDFTNLPTQYLDACLPFGSKQVPYSPRCALTELIGAIRLMDLDNSG